MCILHVSFSALMDDEVRGSVSRLETRNAAAMPLTSLSFSRVVFSSILSRGIHESSLEHGIVTILATNLFTLKHRATHAYSDQRGA